MKEKDYRYLMGKRRNEVKNAMGECFNFYHSEIWTYFLKKDWFGRWIVLILHFKEDKVYTVHLMKESFFSKIKASDIIPMNPENKLGKDQKTQIDTLSITHKQTL